MDHLIEIDTDLVGIKDKSKIEINNLLSSTGSIYLPPFRDCHYKFIYKLCVGEKKIPKLKTLRIEDIYEFSKNYFDLIDFLSEFDYYKQPNREWMCNIVNTIANEEFREFYDKKLKEREHQDVKSKQLAIKAIPEIQLREKEEKESRDQKEKEEKEKLEMELEELKGKINEIKRDAEKGKK